MSMRHYRAIAEYYDPEHAEQATLRDDVPFLLSKMPKRSQTVLELAVGTARAAISIAQVGHRVVGVDYARDMLDIARRKRDAMGVTPEQLRLVHDNLLRLNLRRKFDWVCLLFNTLLGFTTLEELDAVLQTARRHLKPRTGRFWLDIFNPDLSLLANPEMNNLEPHAFHVPRLDRTVMTVTDVRRDRSPQTQELTIRYTWFDGAGRAHRQRNRFGLTYIFPRELRMLLERNGFRIASLYGNYDGSEVTSTSPRLIACCRG